MVEIEIPVKEKMYQIAKSHADKIIVTSDNPRGEPPEEICRQVGEPFIVDRRQAIGQAWQEIELDDVLIIAGKGHEDYIIFGSDYYYFDDKIQFEIVKKFYHKNILIAGIGLTGKATQKIRKQSSD